MDRRDFLTAAGLTLAAPAMAMEGQARKYRVGLIGTGWYEHRHKNFSPHFLEPRQCLQRAMLSIYRV